MSKTEPPLSVIPDRLLQTIKQGDRVLFLGADLPLDYAGAPLSRPELLRVSGRHSTPRLPRPASAPS